MAKFANLCIKSDFVFLGLAENLIFLITHLNITSRGTWKNASLIMTLVVNLALDQDLQNHLDQAPHHLDQAQE